MAQAPSGNWATIKSPGFQYKLTDEDVLWAARMVYGEGGDERDAPAVLWTMTQLFTPQGKRSKWGNPNKWGTSFRELIQRYSQPINPRWTTPEGTRVASGIMQGETSLCYKAPDRCTSRYLERRRNFQSLSWERIPARLRDITLRWARGDLPNPVPNAVEFANPPTSRGFLGRNPGSVVVLRAGNWFIANRVSKTWPPGLVRVDSGGIGPVWGSILIGGSVLAAVAIGAFIGLRR